jgi:DNA processing protein
MALGIDAAAHDGALAGGSGTVAVLGTGVDVIYPRRHLALSERIALNGALVSELPLGTEPLPGLFPRRNRLIAAMAQGVLVIEAALRSGSLITARLAADYGREVFALPGSIHSPLARGCHALIKEGARLVESVDDLLCEWPGGRPHTHPPDAAHGAAHTAAQASDRISDRISARISASPAPAGQERALSDPTCGRLLAAIGHEPVLPDTLAEHLGMPSSTLGAQLILLEIDGHVVRCPDGRVVRQGPSG